MNSIPHVGLVGRFLLVSIADISVTYLLGLSSIKRAAFSSRLDVFVYIVWFVCDAC